ncbi:MAG: MMPL family transporter [Deltaproteobacteria bacterium]
MRLSTTALARGSARRPWLTLALWAAALAAIVAVIVLVLPGTLTAQYSFLGNPDSQRGRDLLQQRMNMPQKANEIVIVRSTQATASDPAFRAAVLSLQNDIAALGPTVVDGAVSAYRGGDKTLISADGRTAIIPVVMAGDLTQAEKNIDKVHDVVHRADGKGGFDTLVTGAASINSDFSHTAETDLRKGEGIGVPIALVILLIVFGAVVAAGLPILLSLIAITMAIGLTALVGQTFDVSVFAINMVSMMGLATGIDYSLFIISRFREERARGRDKLDAIAVTGGTASRAVLFSGLTVVLALLGLLIVPTNIFASLAIGAILVVSMAVTAALTLLPAVLSLLGDRVNSLKVPYLGRRILDNRSAGRTSWIARVAYRAMKRPALALAVGVGVLLLLAYPALDMKTGVSGVNTFPNSFESKQGFAVLEQQFSAGAVNPVEIVVDGKAATPAVQTAMARLTQELAGDPAFGPVQAQTAKSGNLALLTVPVNGDAVGGLALGKVRELRDTLIPRAFDGSGASVYVTGQTAGNIDYIDIVNSYFPWVVALVLSLSFLLLLVAFRSVVIPLKAILMNLLSVGAAYGLVTLVSLKGWGASLLGFEQVPVVEQWVPLLLFAVLFGLSMDYQVFLLSRIKEAWDRTGDNTLAVTEGIGATAGIITGAALIMVAVFAGFAAGDLVMFQQMGFGLAVAVLLDATLIRTILVPSAMKLLGRWNWYLPSWLEWLPHLSIEGAPAAPSATPAPSGPGAPVGPGLEPVPAEERAA